MTHYLSSEYKTTSDHLSTDKLQYEYDSGFHSYQSTTTSPYCSASVDSDGFQLDYTRCDSGRGPPGGGVQHSSTRGKESSHRGSEIVVGNSGSAFVSGYGRDVGVHGNLVRSNSAFVPTSSYHTHPPDNRHPKQEMIAPIKPIGRLSGTTSGSAHQLHQHINPSVASIKNRPIRHSSANDVYDSRRTTRQQQDPVVSFRQRSVSPQFERRVTANTISTSTINKQQVAPSSNYKVAEPKLLVSGHGTSEKKSKFKRRKINMADQCNRENSFHQYPVWVGKIVPLLLAMNGFFFTGQEDVVKCFACSVVLDDWKKDDNVLERHFIASPNCVFIRKKFLSDIIGNLCFRLFSRYSDRSTRYASFRFWPIRGSITEAQMMEAGFFYENVGVTAQCYACGIVKDDWREGDDPIEMHMKLSPECPHLMELQTPRPVQKIYQVKYKTCEDRLKSFKNMPSDSVVNKVELAQAGFVLLSPPCTVKCMDCNLIIEDWEKDDDPLIKHFKRNPSCKFIEACQPTAGHHGRSSPILKKKVSIVDDKMDEDSYMYNSLVQFPPSYKNQYSTSSSGSGDSYSLPSRQVSNDSLIAVTSSVGSNVSYSRSKSTPQPSTLNLEDEEDDDSSKLCIVCYENPKECAIVPCGHLCVCMSCAGKLDHCPICRQPKQTILKIFIP